MNNQFYELADDVPPELGEVAESDARQRVTSVRIAIVGEEMLQHREVEKSWMRQVGWFFRHVADAVMECGFPIDSRYGDQITLTAPARHATDMVNLAIRVQEEMRRKTRQGADGGAGQISFNISIAVVTGMAARYRAPDGIVSYTGKPMSQARRLCEAATARAIFVDRDTERSCNGFEIESELGKIDYRTPEQYFGPLASIPLEPVALEYFELYWENDRFGVKNEIASQRRPSTTPEEPTSPAATATVPAQRNSGTASTSKKVDRQAGKVKVWLPDRGFGFVVSDQGEEFYFNRQLLAFDDDEKNLKPDVRVAFIALSSSQGGQNRRAGAVLLDGQPAYGDVVSECGDRGYGWIIVKDAAGTKHLVHMSKTATTLTLTRGTEVDFTVRVSAKGADAGSVAVSTPEATSAPAPVVGVRPVGDPTAA